MNKKPLPQELLVIEEVPDSMKHDTILQQDYYLSRGELKPWSLTNGQIITSVITPNGVSPVLGVVPMLDAQAAKDMLIDAKKAFQQGRGEWPSASSQQRIATMKKFVDAMKQ